MYRRLLGATIIALGLILAVPNLASAHVLKIDGHIGAILHINPDDNPIAGQSTDYVISFDDDTGEFSLPTCDCTVTIIRDGQTLATNPLAIQSDAVSEDHYIFPSPAVYTMRFTGKPKGNDTFQPFTLDYEVRVAGNNGPAAQSMPLSLWIGIGMATGLVLLAASSIDDDSAKVTKEKDS